MLAGGWNKFAASADAGSQVPDHLAPPERTNAAEGGAPETRTQIAQPNVRTSPRLRPKQRHRKPRNRRKTRPRKRHRRSPRARPKSRSLARPLILLRVLSKPTGADVYLNGKRQGKTPAALRVRRGSTVRVKLKKKGYVAKTISVRVNKTMTQKVTLIEDLF